MVVHAVSCLRLGSWWRVAALAVLLPAVTVCGSPLAGQEGVTVTAGDYGAGWLHRLLFGDDYRDLWTAPVRVPLLDLQEYAGGLTAVRTGGFGQTISLHFDGADGRRYVFRSIDKDLSRRLEEGLLGTFVEDIIQDQTSSYHPSAPVVSAALVEAAGVLASKPEMFVMPDDPALGEFREAYAGMLGTIMENPDEGPDNTPGFAGSTRVTGSDRVLRETEETPRQRLDAVGFLKARLLDVFLGDRDRHKGQWKWARFQEGDGYRWEVVAEDRDQPFVKQDGLILGIARTFFVRKLTNFSADYNNLVGLTWNGWDLDRRFFAGLKKAVWDSVALDLQRRFTDGVIEDAVRRMPAEYYALRGEQLTHELKQRRDNLPAVADEYYRLMASVVEIHATDEDEIATVDRNADGTVRVEVALTPTSAPHFRRTFHPDETKEIRLDLHGGEDRAVVRGPGDDITIRVIGGGDSDQLVDVSPGATYFYDQGNGTDFVSGEGTRIDRRDFDYPPSPDFAHERPLDWGHWVKPLPEASFSPDFGLFLGGGINRYQYGFRKFPYSSRVVLTAGFAFGAGQPTVDLMLEQREVKPRLHLELGGRLTGLEIIRFYGFGNETELIAGSGFYKVDQKQSHLSLGLAFEPTDNVRFALRGIGKVAVTDRDDPTLLQALGRDFYGTGTFAQVGLNGEARVDFRDRPVAASKGLYDGVGGSVYGPWIDVAEKFGEVHGDIAVYVTAGATLALRAAAKKVFGTFPFQEAAYIGGDATLRGFSQQRFAGDASVFGNAELRIPVAPVRVVFPGNFGVHGLVDVGRVYSDFDLPGENTWHTAVGGGVWLWVLNPANLLSVSVAHSRERTGVYVRTGFHF